MFFIIAFNILYIHISLITFLISITIQVLLIVEKSIDSIFSMRTVAIVVSLLLVLLFVTLAIREDGIFKFHPSLMAVSVS